MSSFEIGWDFGLSDHQKKKIEANNIVAQMFNPPECISDGREVWQIDLPRWINDNLTPQALFYHNLVSPNVKGFKYCNLMQFSFYSPKTEEWNV